MLLVDRELRVVDCNQAAVEAYGYPRAELLERSLVDLRALEARAEIPAQLARAKLETTRFSTIERSRDGTQFPVESSWTVSEQSGSWLLLVQARLLVNGERTLQKRNAACLAALNQSLRVASEPLEIMRMASETIARHLEVSRVVFLALDEPTGLASVLFERGGGPGSSLATAYQTEMSTDAELESLRIGLPVAVEDARSDPRAAARAEIYRDLEVGSLLHVPFMNGGRLEFVLAVARVEPGRWSGRDVEVLEQAAARVWARLERVDSERRLRESEDRFRTMAQSVPATIWSATPDGTISFHNERWQTYSGLSADTAALDWPRLVLHPDDYRRCVSAWRRALATGEHLQIEMRARRADGVYRWFLARASPVRDPGGRVIAWFGSTTDIDDNKRIETELRSSQERLNQALAREAELRAAAEEANRLKDEFVATVSHELRTPLHAIVGWAAVLDRSPPSSDIVAKGIEAISRNARAQAQLIDDLLDVSRAITGKLRLELRPVELVRVIDFALESVRDLAESKRVRIAVERDQEVGPVSGDQGRLQQVVFNLLENAVKFSPEGGLVEVRLCRVGDRARIEVRDSGQGIDPDFLPFVFERFRQADVRGAGWQGGLGLGLAIVRHLVELHGGEVRGESAGLGRGSTFTVDLPMLTPRVGGPGVGPRSRVEPVRLDGIRVLVVDDDPDARQLIALMLEEAGARAATAGSVAEALEFFAQARPDLVLSDIAMPGEDGFALLRAIRGLTPEQGGQVPVAAVTAYAGADDRLRILVEGFDLHLPKPVEPAELIAAVESLVGGTRRGGRFRVEPRP
jgi:PAS domain S-box-containing protein